MFVPSDFLYFSQFDRYFIHMATMFLEQLLNSSYSYLLSITIVTLIFVFSWKLKYIWLFEIWLRRYCVLNRNFFLCICGEYIFEEYRKPISDFVKIACHEYLCNQDKPSVVCLRLWSIGRRDAMQFVTPTIWREPRNQ